MTREVAPADAAIRTIGETAYVSLAAEKLVRGSTRTTLGAERMDRRARRKRETLRRIEEAGWQLFRTQGYESTSTRQIAGAADIAIGTLFNYFPEKRSLLIHLMQRQIDDAVARAVESLEGEELEAQLMHIFDALTECYARERRLSRVFVKELLFTDGEQRAGSAAWAFGLVKTIASIVDESQRRGELDSAIDSMEAAQQLFSSHYFGLVTWLGGTIPSRAAHREQVRASLRLLLRGLRRSAA